MFRSLLLLLAACLCVDVSAAQDFVPGRREAVGVVQGPYDGNGLAESTVYDHLFDFQGPWASLVFTNVNLGTSSRLEIISNLDGSVEEFVGGTMANCQGRSSLFNGGQIVVRLHVAPNDRGVGFRLDSADVGQHQFTERSLCGEDNRSRSTDNRIARFIKFNTNGSIGICTAYLSSAGIFITAGHCFDADGDGNRDANNGYRVEFNVPSSNSNGTIVFAAPQDQYPVNNSQFLHDPSVIAGRDFACFDTTTNSSGQHPQQRQGYFRLCGTGTFLVGADLRVTGHGDDTGINYATQQTSTGQVLSNLSVGLPVPHWYAFYQADTEAGSSGSPLFVDSRPGYAAGIHTDGGCSLEFPPAGNAGTDIRLPALNAMLADFPGPDSRFVDRTHAHRVTTMGSGTPLDPDWNVTRSATTVANGGTVYITDGTYNDIGRFDRPQRWVAPFGGVRIGVP
ncbi:MAG: trypsin-like peptidase domain-containing protein [Planctomycetota bacterium]|nr:trypsin-like peptidase domain-containing protein [Planctomycetota bacterium]